MIEKSGTDKTNSLLKEYIPKINIAAADPRLTTSSFSGSMNRVFLNDLQFIKIENPEYRNINKELIQLFHPLEGVPKIKTIVTNGRMRLMVMLRNLELRFLSRNITIQGYQLIC
jgi:hypothetical protein